MSFDMDEEILQDFLIEAGEILELLSEQLVDLERRPDDRELLNAIFRGFHTVKGGAGFLSLSELVDTCHGAENVFDNLRNGGRPLTSDLMDTILQALDTVNGQFSAVKNREAVMAADQKLLDALHFFSLPSTPEEILSQDIIDTIPPESPQKATSIESSLSPEVTQGDGVDDISEDEFEKLLDELHGKGRAPSGSAPADITDTSADITDDEFEQLLDQLHGVGQGPARSAASSIQGSNGENSSDEITDDEFEKLLDDLHGKGKSPSAQTEVEAEEANDKHLAQSSAAGLNLPTGQVLLSSEKPVSATQSAQVEDGESKIISTREDKKLSAPQGEQTVRVNTATLDTIMNMVGELVLVRNRLVSLGANSVDENMAKAVTNLDVVTADLQGAVMQTRMQPIKKVFGRFPRVVRDLARSLKKEIVLEMRGEETDLDKNLVEALADPMVHLVRNSVDHGIEMPDVREQNGKPRVGTVTLAASQEGDHILLTIEDDGGGMDAMKLRGIAVSRGVLDADAAARLTDSEAFNLIFAPGFSTKTEISDISGRGVGMDVVKTAITRLNGTISIESELGSGTTILIKVPLTLAILPTLMVGVGDSPFALPLSNVNEIIRLD